MKVSLVAEVLSMSVALSECRSLGVEGLLGSPPTEIFFAPLQ